MCYILLVFSLKMCGSLLDKVQLSYRETGLHRFVVVVVVVVVVCVTSCVME